MCLGSQAKSIRYENAGCAEIGVKFNRSGDIILVVENVKSKKEFCFQLDDIPTLNVFEIMFTNIVGFYNSFDKNYGRKVNDSQMNMLFKIVDREGNSLEVGAGREVGIRFEIQSTDGVAVKFTFAPEDKNILEMFKMDLSNVIKNNMVKLPPVTKTNAIPSENSGG